MCSSFLSSHLLIPSFICKHHYGPLDHVYDWDLSSVPYPIGPRTPCPSVILCHALGLLETYDWVINIHKR